MRLNPVLRILSPQPESVVEGTSFSVSAVAPSELRLHVLLRVDAEVHDVTALVRAAAAAAAPASDQGQGQGQGQGERVEFNVQVHGASTGFHTLVLYCVPLSEADEAAGLDATKVTETAGVAFDSVRFQVSGAAV